jgi:ABC-type uncharacterized transport system substrate-binding protein
MGRRLAALGLAVAALMLSRDQAATHPHVWVEGTAILNFDAERRIPTVTVRYVLDELTTAVLMEGLDKNGNGIYDREELKATAAENAESLGEFDYFFEVSGPGGRIPVSEVVEYDYAYEDGRMVLSLELRLDTPIDAGSEKFSVRLYDPSFYVLVELAPEPVLVTGVAAELCQVTIKTPAESSQGVSFSDAILEGFDPMANIGRDYSDEIGLSCGAD